MRPTKLDRSSYISDDERIFITQEKDGSWYAGASSKDEWTRNTTTGHETATQAYKSIRQDRVTH